MPTPTLISPQSIKDLTANEAMRAERRKALQADVERRHREARPRMKKPASPRTSS